MKQGAESPLVTTGLEQFRDAATWEAVITNLTSSAAAYEVHGYGGGSLPHPVGCSQAGMISGAHLQCFIPPAPVYEGNVCEDAAHVMWLHQWCLGGMESGAWHLQTGTDS